MAGMEWNGMAQWNWRKAGMEIMKEIEMELT
jgi:hypothetical protein